MADVTVIVEIIKARKTAQDSSHESKVEGPLIIFLTNWLSTKTWASNLSIFVRRLP